VITLYDIAKELLFRYDLWPAQLPSAPGRPAFSPGRRPVAARNFVAWP